MLLIWGVRDSSSLTTLIGLWSLAFGTYLALGPSIYFFAQRQRQSRTWIEISIAGVIFHFRWPALDRWRREERAFQTAVVQMEARLVENGSDWQIDTIEWYYPEGLSPRR